MPTSSSIVMGLLVTCTFLLGILTLRLAAKGRQQKRAYEQLTEALQRSIQEAEQQKSKLVQRTDLDTVKDEFISTVSHELRTPLTSIRGAIGLLSAGLLGNVDAKAQNLLRIASTNTERLIRLINDILDLERMDSGRAPLNLRRYSIYDLAREAMDTMTSMADAAGVRLELACYAPRDSIYFDADSDRILQVLTNLLSNAIKFSPHDSVVEIQIDSNLDSIVLKVVDEGRGIPADKLETIFDRFQQVESSDASKKGGTGLGLAICRSIVQQHGGAIWAQPNHAGPGTTLWVQFSRSARASDSAAPSQIASTVQRGEGLVLVCDDDPGIRMVVCELLRLHGYDVLEARAGEEAISLATRNAEDIDAKPISAILLDLYMPGLTGWETLQRLKENQATAHLPVVILSVIVPSDKPTGVKQAQGWVQKPFNDNLLLAELGRVLHAATGPGQILLVEDDADLARIMIAGCEDAGLRVHHASTWQEAVDRCLLGPPDLVILDLTLPDGDGFSLVDWLRKQPALRALPLVVYSGREISEAERAQLRLGPTQFLTKARVQPAEVEELVLAMVESLRNSARTSAA